MPIKKTGSSPETKSQKADRQDREIKVEQGLADWAKDIKTTPPSPRKEGK